MMMTPFSTKFADLAWQETRTITVCGRDELPDGEYAFVESYCDEASCDCRRVMPNGAWSDERGAGVGDDQLWVGE
ncbi:MAG: hypothetical protein H0T92_14530 [Pyrinomonadaceae bacterium]|nr:hypothetical protein [Pyrinomonadaceae bacterium]